MLFLYYNRTTISFLLVSHILYHLNHHVAKHIYCVFIPHSLPQFLPHKLIFTPWIKLNM
nr:MAG TPA: hypothetical protein [Bacteriophage sp.]